MSSLQLLLVILPLGLDTLAVSLSLGIKSPGGFVSGAQEPSPRLSYGWLRLALLFSLAEMLMPIVGLVIGYAVSLVVSNIMHFVGPLLLIGVGVWELWEEARAYLRKKKRQQSGGGAAGVHIPASSSPQGRLRLGRQLLLALSVSMDELAIGFSLGSITSGKTISPIVLCLLIGLQGFLVTIIGLLLGRALRSRLKSLQEASEYLSALLLIGLGVWLLVS